MLKTQKYLKLNGIDQLKKDYSLNIRNYPEEQLYVLNYDQIDSPKSHPITIECRGLIIDYDFNVVCRSFDRFFNLGEVPETQSHIDMSLAIAYDKIDGSLIRIYYYENKWNIATRGTAFGELPVNGFSTTFAELVLLALK